MLIIFLITLMIFIIILIPIVFAGIFFIKIILAAIALIVFGGFYLIFAAAFGHGNEPAAVVAAFFSGVILLRLLFAFNKSKYFSEVNVEDPAIENFLSISMVMRWAALATKKGVRLVAKKVSKPTSRWSKLFLRKFDSYEIRVEIIDSNGKVVAAKTWRIIKLSTEFEQKFSGENIFEIDIKKNPEKLAYQLPGGLSENFSSAMEWLKIKTSKFF